MLINVTLLQKNIKLVKEKNVTKSVFNASFSLTREPSGEKVCLNTFGIFDAGQI